MDGASYQMVVLWEVEIWLDKCWVGWGIEPRKRLCNRRKTTLVNGFRIWENRPCLCNNTLVFAVQLKNLC
jgi:hypothetical protein